MKPLKYLLLLMVACFLIMWYWTCQARKELEIKKSIPINNYERDSFPDIYKFNDTLKYFNYD